MILLQRNGCRLVVAINYPYPVLLKLIYRRLRSSKYEEPQHV